MLVPLLLAFFEHKELKKKNLAIKEELLATYPELISKFSLLTLAGLSIAGAIRRLVDEYNKEFSLNGKKIILYEELGQTCRQLENGVYETFAYEQFGKRIGLSCYIKFSSILISGLKHGNSDFNRQLATEAVSALLEHKADILRHSSKASTKLLGPMMLIFTVILVIIMIPAFLSMNI
ncbi:MAG: type II secretion system F family protein [Lachnospiraceae bacterium]|nr:type II secretion system F family protein [Lachnospiraceae bacterium]